MSKDEQARARLVEIADEQLRYWTTETALRHNVEKVRRRAGFKNPRTGSWCAAGLTAAMEDAGLLVPAPGTPARRGAVALLDWVGEHGQQIVSPSQSSMLHWVAQGEKPQPGDVIAWLQHPPGKDPAGWRRGHVALIVAVDDESITTVGWNEGNAPGRVMKRRLWRDPMKICQCGGALRIMRGDQVIECPWCKGSGHVPRSSTALYRRPGGLYGIARPVAR